MADRPISAEGYQRLRQELFGVDSDVVEEGRFGRIAVAGGHVSEEDLRRAVAEQEALRLAGQPLKLGQVLLRLGLITVDALLDILAIQNRGLLNCPNCDRLYDISGHPSGARVQCPRCGHTMEVPEADDVLEAQPRPTPYSLTLDTAGNARLRLGRYVLNREVARGGMGIVFEAVDTELRRRVALKILREGEADAQVIHRLHREASIAAQLQHPNIVAVHEVGMVRDSEGRPTHFIAMDFVDGHTLEERLGRHPEALDDHLRILEEVARAVDYAHERGVIHRDLKPSNVMVEASGRAILTDFGLAHAEFSQTRLTRSHSVMGTPNYMAPEQVLGRTGDIDARTDVYALGVMLYEILARRVPFTAESPAELFNRILNLDPVPPDRGGDVALVCLKAMDKDRARRYATAREFADDLARARAGEPITARPASRWYRLKRRVRKNPLLYGVGVAGAAGILLAVGILLPNWLAAERDAIEAMRETARVSHDAALELRRAGRPAAMEQFLPPLEEAYRKAGERDSDDPEPPYLMGHVCRAMMRFEEALKHQREALRRRPDYAPSLRERAVLLSRSTWDERAYHNRRLLSDEQVNLIRQEIAANVDSLGDPIYADWAEGIKRVQSQERLEGAREPLERAARGGVPEAFEALIQGSMISAKLNHGVKEREALRMAIAWADEGIARDRGYLPYRLLRAEASVYLAETLSDTGEDPESICREAIEQTEAVLEMAPPSAAAFVEFRYQASRVKADALHVLAIYKLTTGGDAGTLLEEAIAELDDAAALAADDPELRAGRGRVRLSQAMADAASGRDPAARCREAFADFDAALDVDPDLRQALEAKAYGLLFQSRLPGSEPESATLGIRCLDRLLEVHKLEPDALSTRGQLHTQLGIHALASGRDSADHFQRALTDLDAALEMKPDVPETLVARASANFQWSRLDAAIGEDALPRLRRAEADCTRALKLNPRSGDALVQRAQVRLKIAGGVHETLYPQVVDDLERALPLRHDKAELHFRIAVVLNEWGRQRHRERREWIPLFERFVFHIDEMAKLDPDRELPAAGAEPYYELGRDRHGRGEIDDAIELYSGAIRWNPSHAQAYNDRGAAQEAAGRLEDAARDFAQALKVATAGWKDRRTAEANLARVRGLLGLGEEW